MSDSFVVYKLRDLVTSAFDLLTLKSCHVACDVTDVNNSSRMSNDCALSSYGWARDRQTDAQKDRRSTWNAMPNARIYVEFMPNRATFI